MTVIERVRKVIKWLIFIGYAESDTDIAEKLGYGKSSLSQILNMKVPLSDKFIKKLCTVDENINFNWIKEGSGTMLKSLASTGNINLVEVDSLFSQESYFEKLCTEKDKEIANLKELQHSMIKEVGFALQERRVQDEKKNTG